MVPQLCSGLVTDYSILVRTSVQNVKPKLNSVDVGLGKFLNYSFLKIHKIHKNLCVPLLTEGSVELG